jgi:hypothetical protein
VEEEVPRLEVAVDDALVVRDVEPARDVRDEAQRGARGEELLPAQHDVERLALEQLHHQVRRAHVRVRGPSLELLDATEIVDLDDAPMAQPA